MNEILDKKVLIGTDGLTIRELLECERMVLVPLDETTLDASVLEGDKRTWRDFIGDNLTPDLFFAGTPIKRIMMTASVDSDDRVLIKAPRCVSMTLEVDEKHNNVSKVEVKTEGKDIKTIADEPPCPRTKYQYFLGEKICFFEKERFSLLKKHIIFAASLTTDRKKWH